MELATGYQDELGAANDLSFHPASLAITYGGLTVEDSNTVDCEWAQIANGECAAPEELSNKAREFLAALDHEYDHMARFLSTPYGYLWHIVEFMWFAHGWRELASAANREAELPRAGLEFRRQMEAALHAFSSTPGSSRAYLGREAVAGRDRYFLAGAAERTLRALSGQVPSSSLHGVLALLNHVHAVSAGEVKPGSADGLNHQLSHELISQRSTAPLWTDDPPLAITPTHILETFAVIAHIQRSATLGLSHGNATSLIVPPTDTAVQGVRPEQTLYWLLIGYWKTLMPDAMYELRAADMQQDQEYGGMWRIYPVEFYAALDWALWIPFGPRGFVGKQRPTWETMNPAWRLVRICRRMQEDRTRFTRWGDVQPDERFHELQRHWSQLEGEPPPDELAALWSKAFRSLSEYPLLEACNSEGERGRWSRADQLLAVRAASPVKLVLGQGTAEWIGHGSHAWVSPVSETDRQLCVRAGESTDSISSAIRYLMTKLIYAFLHGQPARMSVMHHAPLLRYAAQRFFGENPNPEAVKGLFRLLGGR